MTSAFVSVEEEGYGDERFETAVRDNLHCAICLNVLKQPMQCVKNEHSFCRPCIHRHLQQTQRCPTCIEPLTLQTLRPSRVVAGFLSELNISCDNSARGCIGFVKLENLEAHVARCGFSPVQCSNEGCDVMINRNNQVGHETNECNFRLARCEVCGENVNYSQRKLHCYVTRGEIDEIKRSLKETKDEMKRGLKETKDEMKRGLKETKDEMSTVTELVLDMSRKMAKLTRDVEEMKHDMAAIKKESHFSKQEPESDARSLGASFACFQPNTNIREDIIIAGGRGLKSVEKFCWSTRQWAFLSAMTSERYFSSSFVHGDQMFVCGGTTSEDTIEILELKEEGGEWKKIQTKLPQKTWGHASTVYEDNLFIFGGESDYKVVNNIYKVGLVSPYRSQLVSHLPEARSEHGAQRFGDKVAIVGGTKTGGYSGSVDKVLLYDITRNCCRTLAPLPFAVSDMATVAWRDNIIIIGGRDKKGNYLNTVVSYNITNEKSKMLPSMKYERSVCTAVRTGNVIVVMGGCCKEEELNSVESFSFDNNSWEELPSMNEERVGATAVARSIP